MTDYKIGDRVPMPPKEGFRRMRDVVPNGDDFRSRIYAARLRNEHDGTGTAPMSDLLAASTNAMFAALAQKHVSCPECEADPGEKCLSVAKGSMGKVMEATVHSKRFRMAKRLFARKDQA